MRAERSKTQADAQAGSSGQAAAVGPEVGGVHSNDELSWVDLWALSPEYRSPLKEAGRNGAHWHAPPRRKGAGEGPDWSGITTPEKLRKLQRALYRKAKAEAD
jgi:diadenosine tetraphosphate (Ap4A) HIT family hydrolase